MTRDEIVRRLKDAIAWHKHTLTRETSVSIAPTVLRAPVEALEQALGWVMALDPDLDASDAEALKKRSFAAGRANGLDNAVSIARAWGENDIAKAVASEIQRLWAKVLNADTEEEAASVGAVSDQAAAYATRHLEPKPEPKPEPEPVEFDVGDTVTRAGREAVVSSPNGNLAVIKITYYDGTWELVAASDCKLLFSHGEARPVRGSSTGA